MGKRQTFYANLVDQRIRERGLFVRGFSAPCIKHTHTHAHIHTHTRAHGETRACEEARRDCDSLSRAPPLRDNV